MASEDGENEALRKTEGQRHGVDGDFYVVDALAPLKSDYHALAFLFTPICGSNEFMNMHSLKGIIMSEEP